MKTPRELLLSRHAALRPKLDALRRRVVAEHLGPVPVEETERPMGLLVRIWAEVIWPSRRAWAGLAVAWVVIVGLNLAAFRDSPSLAGVTARATPMAVRELRLVLGEQARLRAELLEVRPPPSERVERAVPGPRSENVKALKSTNV